MVHQGTDCTDLRLVGQAVKTPASHAGNAGSIPARVTTSARAAMVVQKIYSSIAQSVEHSAVNRVVVGSSPTGGAKRILTINSWC